MKLFILGGTGNSGQRLVRMALDRSHQVTAFVRDREKLVSKLGGVASNGLKITTAAIDDSGALAAGMSGHDAVINAAGNVNDGPSFTRLVRTAIGAAVEALGADGRLWLFGGAALLDVPGTRVMALDLPKIPPIYESHRINLEAVQATKLDWSMLCPGPMIDAPDGKPTENLIARAVGRVSIVAIAALTHGLGLILDGSHGLVLGDLDQIIGAVAAPALAIPDRQPSAAFQISLSR